MFHDHSKKISKRIGENGIELNMAKAKHMEFDALDWSQFGIVTIVSMLNTYTITTKKKTKVFFDRTRHTQKKNCRQVIRSNCNWHVVTMNA